MPQIRHAYSQSGDQLYETPREATEALLRAETLPQWIYEPAAGKGAIAEVLRDAGHAVICHDLVDYGFPLHAAGRDFLLEPVAPYPCECIVTNPPFKLAADFVRIGLKLCPKVIVLLRLVFLESAGRSDILDTGQLARVHIFKERLPRMHRDGWSGPISTSTTAYAWFVFDRNHNALPTLHRISWRQSDRTLTVPKGPKYGPAPQLPLIETTPETETAPPAEG